MNSSINNMERFDAYLNHEMSESDRAVFEQELAKNAELKAEFLIHKEFLSELEEGAEYYEIRSNLRVIHNKPGVGDRNFFLSPQFYVPLAAVAIIALIVTIVNPFVKEGNDSIAFAPDADEEKYEATLTESQADSISAEYVPGELDFSQTPTLSPDDQAVYQTTPVGTVFMISNKGYFLASKTAEANESIVKLQSANKKKSFEAAVVYRDPTQSFVILKCHPETVENVDSIPIPLFQGELDTIKRVFTIGFDEGVMRYFEADLARTNDKSDASSSLPTYFMKIKTAPSMTGSPVFTMDGQLIGLIVSVDQGTSSVTYLLDAYYIGTKLDYLSEEDIDLTMKENYHHPARSRSEFLKAFKPFIFELHP